MMEERDLITVTTITVTVTTIGGAKATVTVEGGSVENPDLLGTK